MPKAKAKDNAECRDVHGKSTSNNGRVRVHVRVRVRVRVHVRVRVRDIDAYLYGSFQNQRKT